jgi:hypothetical protein
LNETWVREQRVKLQISSGELALQTSRFGRRVLAAVLHSLMQFRERSPNRGGTKIRRGTRANGSQKRLSSKFVRRNVAFDRDLKIRKVTTSRAHQLVQVVDILDEKRPILHNQIQRHRGVRIRRKSFQHRSNLFKVILDRRKRELGVPISLCGSGGSNLKARLAKSILISIGAA